MLAVAIFIQDHASNLPSVIKDTGPFTTSWANLPTGSGKFYVQKCYMLYPVLHEGNAMVKYKY